MTDHSDCALAIVGSRGVSSYQSSSIIKQAILDHHPKIVISGGAGGVDMTAVEVASELGIATLEFVPTVMTWDAEENRDPRETMSPSGMVVHVPGGFKKRNIKIVETCDCLVRISSASSTTYGSGWTADLAEQRGKRVTRFTV